MTGLLRALAEVRGQAYTARQRATWEGIRRQLGMGLREVVVQRGRLVGAAELRQGLVERVEGVLGEDAGLMGRTVGARRLHCDFRTLVEWVVEVAGVAMEEREGVVGRGGV
ncbi:hypothetical protein Tdes44962_MAKER08777 [Teratosphaeria destructans]|uniref:Uncharacterized protein n=1 Tax=Teratosphaeria destructans TaxID=418781 RepID=A0A9W7SW67_9PEZI|nr:hypothetical protein Tdes44962_MAKER08777 [Teratosphaeria destructans]